MDARTVARTIGVATLAGSLLGSILGFSRLNRTYQEMSQHPAWNQAVAYAAVEDRLSDAELQLAGTDGGAVVIPCGVGCIIPAYDAPIPPDAEGARAALEDALSLYRTTIQEGTTDGLSLEPRVSALLVSLPQDNAGRSPLMGTYETQRTALSAIRDDVRETAQRYNAQVPAELDEDVRSSARLAVGSLVGMLGSTAALGLDAGLSREPARKRKRH